MQRSYLLFFTFVAIIAASPLDASAGTSFAKFCPEPFIRGDVDGDQDVDVLDAYFLLNALFVPGSAHPVCDDVADIDDMGGVNFFDATLLFRYIFLPNEPPPQQPFPSPGFDEQAITGWALCDEIDNDQDGHVDEGENCRTWARAIGDVFDQRAHSVAQTADGGYVLAGSLDDGDRKATVVKVDEEGMQEWSTTLGGAGITQQALYSVLQNTDGDYVAAGEVEPLGSDPNAYLVKLASDGSLIWQRTFGGNQRTTAYSVRQTSDGGYVLAGIIDALGVEEDIYLVKTSENGDLEWEKTIFGFGRDIGRSVQQTTDGGYVVAGYSNSSGAGGFDAYLVKTDALGDAVWERAYGGVDIDLIEAVQQTTDGGYVLAGSTRSFGNGNFDFYLLKTDSLGLLEWDQTFGSIGSDRGYSVKQTIDGGYVAVGSSAGDAYVVKARADGMLEWDRLFGGSSGEYAGEVVQNFEGGYVIAGATQSFGTGFRNIYLVKMDPAGNVAECSDLLDNDLDGTTDYPNDLECDGPYDASEGP